MRKVAAATLAAPVLVRLYLSLVLPRSLAARLGIIVLIGAVIGVGGLALTAARPEATTASRPRPIVAVPAGALRTDLRTRQGTNAGVELAFTAPMNRDSVRAALDVEPPAAVRVGWNADGTAVTVEPLGRWAHGTYYTVTVQPGALAASGAPLASPVRAAFLTRPMTLATIGATAPAGDRVRPNTAFVVDFDGPIDPATLAGGLHIDPPVAGSWQAVDDLDATRWVFAPVGALAADATYRVSLSSRVRDPEGGPVASATLEVRTAPAPSVVRFRPLDKATGVDRGTSLSVRFTQPMDRAATEKAFAATVGGKAIAGAYRWAEGDTVLILDPSAALGYEQTVTLEVSRAATSALGVPLAAPATATFATVPKPAPPPPPPAPRASGGSSGGSGSGGSGGGSVGSGGWTAVESYYLKLMNCTRTGGLVTSSGGCSSPGGRNVAPLALDSGISSRVARPYARLLATRNACSHFLDGNPGDRLRRAGYTNYTWAENIGCRSGDPYGAVLGSHLYFQSERSWSPPGGHYVNLMNAKYDRAGIGVWVSSGRVRLVVDFYHP